MLVSVQLTLTLFVNAPKNVNKLIKRKFNFFIKNLSSAKHQDF